MVFDQWVKHHSAIPPAHRYLRQLPIKANEPLQQQAGSVSGGNFIAVATGPLQYLPCLVSAGAVADKPLSLSVVTHPACLENGGRTDFLQTAIEILSRLHGNERCRRNAETAKKLLFVEAILARFERGGRGINGYTSSQLLRCLDRDILELIGGDFQPLREASQRIRIAEIGTNKFGKIPNRRFMGGVEKSKPQTQRITRQGQHAPQLSRSQYTDHIVSRGQRSEVRGQKSEVRSQ